MTPLDLIIVSRTGVWPTPWAWEVTVRVAAETEVADYRNLHTLRGNALTRSSALIRAAHAMRTMKVERA